MEARVAILETKLDHVQSDVTDLKSRAVKVDERLGGVEVKLATLTERVAHLPSKGFIVTTVLLFGSLFTAITVFADKIQALLAG